jgi:protein ImuA
MKLLASKADIVRQLQQEILSLQGFPAVPQSQHFDTGLGAIEKSFPGAVFPTGAIHEFLSLGPEDAAATSGFMAGLMSCFMQSRGACLWISTGRTLFPPALKVFGLAPERIIFIDLTRKKDALWAIEEALKCPALAAVVGELSEVSFTESRRLQLAVEQSRVTGFIHRYRPKNENQIACVSRWKITSLASAPHEGLPGVGFPRWNVQLRKVRNGKPGAWQIEWAADGFRIVPSFTASVPARDLLKTASYA